MVDPAMGNWSHSYNAFGELISQTDSLGQTTTMARVVVAIAAAVYLGPASSSALVSASSVGGSAVAAGFANAAIAGAAAGMISGGGIKSAVNGAFSGSLFFGVGQYMPGDAGSFSKILGHATAGCISSSVGGGSCHSGAMAAGFAEAALPMALKDVNAFEARVAVMAIVGGTASVIGGGKFENGAVTAAFGYLFNYCAHATTKCGMAWASNLGKLFAGGAGMFGGAALCTTGVGCALGSVGVITGGANVYEAGDWFVNGSETVDGRNPIKQAIKTAVPSANADLAYASIEVLGGGAALKAPVILKNELWITTYGIEKIPSLLITRPASTLPSGVLDAAGAAWDGTNAAIDQWKKRP